MMPARPRRLALLIAAIAMASPVAAKDKKPVDPNKKVCRADGSTGSIMPSKTCHTVAEWARIDATMSNTTHPGGDVPGHGGARPAGF